MGKKNREEITSVHICIYIYISQEKSVVTLLPIMRVTKLLLTTPEIKILFTVRFDYLYMGNLHQRFSTNFK